MTGPSPEMLADMYHACTIREEHEDEIAAIVSHILLHKPVYDAVQIIPWWAAAVLNQMESSGRLDRHAHNGDPLMARTVQVPRGRPVAPPANGKCYTWAESAADAYAGMANVPWLDLGASLWALERFNGFGYRKQNINSPYLWSYTDQYRKGKYVADGKFDPEAVSKQCGIVPIMKTLGPFTQH